MPRSVIGTAVESAIPLTVILAFAIFWTHAKSKNNKDNIFLLKRCALSAIAVFYVSYISLTKTFVNILNCIEVNDSTSIFFDSISNYWAVDTSLKCYEGPHAVLAGTLGWPLVVSFSLGFPVALACSIVRFANGENYKEGWIYDVAGFMYRSYKPYFIFWESIVMLRKALLAIVVVLAYPLGADNQSVLAVAVLLLSLYVQKTCCPFRNEFEKLNDFEGYSLLVSSVTLLFGLFFHGNPVSGSVGNLITAGLLAANISLFLFFLAMIFIYTTDFLRHVLDQKNISHNDTGFNVLKNFFHHFVLVGFKKKCAQLADYIMSFLFRRNSN